MAPEIQALLDAAPKPVCRACGTELRWHTRDPRGPGCPPKKEARS